MKLSILICSLESREEMCGNLLNNLLNQLGKHAVTVYHLDTCEIERFETDKVEILICTDNRVMKVGDKRNLLMKFGRGEYQTFIDDDDRVRSDYIQQLLRKMETSPDCIVFNVFRNENGKPDRLVVYGKEYDRDYSVKNQHYRRPNHIMCIKSKLAKQVEFKPINFGEDADWAARLLPHLKTQERIFDTLYWYDFNSLTTETQK